MLVLTVFFKVKVSTGNNKKSDVSGRQVLILQTVDFFPPDCKQFHGVKSMLRKLASAPAEQPETNAQHSPFLDCPLDLRPLISPH